ncbi:restriction endonuclease subunit S [Geobacillus stearothermophilus]|uniref:restriction endonuclease subunit S n=1 Tax=Geobacillus stearothermophilus TaxID=1422 RepID=UPI001EEE1D2C|nr:restriction endonuclease subunit S [Geobacillus stearothermophilus]MCK7605262.1 restriction endonuclease subunit S [Geobacillus stearothermophilus]
MEYVKLNELCEINIGKTPSRSNQAYWGNGNKWLSISDMQGKYVSNTKEQITDLAVNECKMKIVPKNTVLMSFKLSIGKIAITTEELYTNEAIASFPIIQKDKLIPEYLYYALQTLKLDKLSDRAVKGATLNKDKLNQIKIPLTTLEQQKKIVKVLNKAQELIDKRKAQIEALDQLTQSVFLEMFGDPVSNPKGWDVKKLKDIAEIEDGDRGENYPKQHELVSEGILFLSTSNFVNNKLDLSKVTYITKEKFSQLRKGKLRRGDLIVTLRGSIGNIVIFDEEGYDTGFINAQMAILRLKNVNRIFFQQLYTSNSFQLVLKKTQTGSSQPQLPLKNLKELEIIIPPLELQELFAATIQQINLKKELLLKSQAEIQNMFNSLMQRAFKGELFND